MKDLKEIICKIVPLSDESVNAIAACTYTQSLKKGELLIKEGLKNEALFFVQEGLLRAYHTHQGKEDTLWFAVPGNACASMFCLYKGLPSVYCIEAMTNVELYYIPRADLMELFKQSHELSEWMRTLTFEQLYLLERRYSYIGIGDAYSRFKSLMKMLPMNFIQQIPLKLISSYLGITPQTLSKMRLRYGKEKEY